MTFIDRLNELLEQKGVSAHKMSLQLGLSKSVYTAWKERGNIPPGDVLNKLADYFDVSVDYLLGRVDNPSPKNYNENPSLNNTIKILGRDGTNIEKTLTDDEIEVFKKLISSLPDAEDL